MARQLNVGDFFPGYDIQTVQGQEASYSRGFVRRVLGSSLLATLMQL
jgi:hypothetical protein